MTPCEIVNFIGVITCAIADCVDSDEQLGVLAAIFVQLGDSLATYATYKDACCNNGGDAAPAPLNNVIQ